VSRLVIAARAETSHGHEGDFRGHHRLPHTATTGDIPMTTDALGSQTVKTHSGFDDATGPMSPSTSKGRHSTPYTRLRPSKVASSCPRPKAAAMPV
jgi:hypothetical protein